MPKKAKSKRPAKKPLEKIWDAVAVSFRNPKKGDVDIDFFAKELAKTMNELEARGASIRLQQHPQGVVLLFDIRKQEPHPLMQFLNMARTDAQQQEENPTPPIDARTQNLIQYVLRNVNRNEQDREELKRQVNKSLVEVLNRFSMVELASIVDDVDKVAAHHEQFEDPEHKKTCTFVTVLRAISQLCSDRRRLSIS